MAGTITKNLKLKAVLDDQAFRKQIQELKKELGNVDVGGGGGGAAGFDRSAKSLSEAAQALRAVVDNLRKGGGTGGGGGRGGGIGGTSARAKDVQTISDEVTKNTSNKIRQYFDAERGKYVNLKPGQTYDKEMGKTFRRDMDHEKTKAIFKEREQKKEQEKSQRFAEKDAKNEARRKEMERKKDIGVAKDIAAAFGSRTGIGLPMARQAADIAGNAAPGLFQRAGGMVRGVGGAAARMMGSGVGMGLGVAGGVAAAGLVGLNMYNSYNANQRQLRTLEAQASQGSFRSILSGEGTRGIIEQGGRTEGSTGLKGFAAGVSQTMSDVFSLEITKALTGQSFKTGKLEAGSAEAETRQEETGLAQDALRRAREMRRMRMDAMRGGAATGDQLTGIQGLGALQGFSGEESIQQFMEARQFLGNEAAVSLPGLQRRMNMTGVGVGDQAQAMETFMGAQRGTTSAQAFTRSFEVLKKGVAAGLDVSKSGKFLQTTADFVRSQQGLGQLDVDQISERLAKSAAGFGGGSVTDTSLRQAAQLQEMLTRESTSTQGFAGLGNTQNILDVVGDQSNAGGLLMSLQNTSANATQGDIEEILTRGGFKGDAAAAARQVLEGKQNAMGRGLSNIGTGPEAESLKLALGGREAGITTEQFLGRERGQAGVLGMSPEDAAAALEGGIPRGAEQESLVQDFKTQNAAFVSGMQSMTSETARLKNAFAEFSKTLEQSRGKLEQYTDSTVRNKTGR